jgi:glycosyltransferase involved in cell wall biosynthesis
VARVLLLTQVLPYPLDAGPKVRAYHMLCHLARRHEVTLVSFTRDDDPPEALAHLRERCHAVHVVPMHRSLARNVWAAARGLATGLPMTIVRDEVGAMVALLRRLVRETPYDVVHADQASMARYGQLAARFSVPHRPATLLDEHNAVYLLARRMADTEANPLRRAVMGREARAFARSEGAMCRAYDALLTVIPEDQDRLLALLPPLERREAARKFDVVPISVDPDAIAPVGHPDGGSPTVVHIGTMFWPPNVRGVLWFAREVLPLVHRQVPEARFVVVGKNPTPEVCALAEDPHVDVTGYVPDAELVAHLERASAFAVPLHAGGGMRVKILDAWLWGLPVVSTSIGAEGIEVLDGENVLIADGAPAFAEATVRALTDRALNARLRAKGRAWVESHYAYPVVYRKVDQVYDRLLRVGSR